MQPKNYPTSRQPHYALRKLNVGTASVIIGLSIGILAHPNTAAADSKLASAPQAQTGESQPVSATREQPVANGNNSAVSTPDTNQLSTAATTSQPTSAIAANNVSKLLPYADQEEQSHYAGLVSTSDKLNQVNLLAAVPLHDNQFVVNPADPSVNVNGVLLAFQDGTMEKLGAHLLSPTNQIYKYQLDNGLAYTPTQVSQFSAAQVEDLVKLFQGIDLFSAEMKEHLNVRTDNEVRDLFMTTAFNNTKAELPALIPALLANSTAPGASSDSAATIEKIKQHRLSIMLGMTYINRLYNISFGEYNILPLMLFRPDFYGANLNALDWLIQLGNLSQEQLKVGNNLPTFNTVLAKSLKVPALIGFLNRNRQMFSPELNNEQWFKDNTGVFIYEVPSKENPNAPVGIFRRLATSKRTRYRSFILPLLNIKNNDMFIIVNMSTITFGLNERYIDQGIKQDPEQYQQKVAAVDTALKSFADHWGEYYDFWYRMTNDQGKQLLVSEDIPVWDSYWIPDKALKQGFRWVGKYDQAVPAIEEFFAPVGDMYQANGSGAYASGSYVHFVVDAAGGTHGTSTLTHEMTHNFDGQIYFNGNGRRQSMGAEAFAMGLLQSAENSQDGDYGFNLAFEFAPNQGRSKNLSPTEFQTPADLQTYMHGVFDVTYLLDYAEAEALLAKSTADKQLAYAHLYYDPAKKSDVITSGIDNATAAKLTSLDSLIDNNIIAKRYYQARDYNKNSYGTISLYSPIYSGAQSEDGSTGTMIFRKTAFELLAEYGWEKGFLPYVSNQYLNDAKKDNVAFNDQYIFNKVFNGQYTSFAEFKKAMFQERINKRSLLKPVTIHYNGSDITLKNYQQLSQLMQQAANQDLAQLKAGKRAGQVDKLKAAIMQSYTLMTDDFKSSIFSEPAVTITVNFVDNNAAAPQDLSRLNLQLKGQVGSGLDLSAVSQAIDELTKAGYTVTDNPLEGVGGQFSTQNDGQTFVVQLNHRLQKVTLGDGASLPAGLQESDLKQSARRTVEIKLPNQTEPQLVNQTVAFQRAANIDQVTGRVVDYDQWTARGDASFAAVTVPTMAGYTPSVTVIPAANAAAGENNTTTVTYAADPQKLEVRFVDPAGKVVAQQTLSGKTDQTIALNFALPDGWKSTNPVPTEWKFRPDNNLLQVPLVKTATGAETPGEAERPGDPEEPTTPGKVDNSGNPGEETAGDATTAQEETATDTAGMKRALVDKSTVDVNQPEPANKLPHTGQQRKSWLGLAAGAVLFMSSVLALLGVRKKD